MPSRMNSLVLGLTNAQRSICSSFLEWTARNFGVGLLPHRKNTLLYDSYRFCHGDRFPDNKGIDGNFSNLNDQIEANLFENYGGKAPGNASYGTLAAGPCATLDDTLIDLNDIIEQNLFENSDINSGKRSASNFVEKTGVSRKRDSVQHTVAGDEPVPSWQLTHVTREGNVHMVDVGGKSETRRMAHARAIVRMPIDVFEMIGTGKSSKGNPLLVAKLSGIQAAKRTSDLIVLCHPISIENVAVDVELCHSDMSVVIDCRVWCTGKTGCEMEALTGASVAALNLYDMCKAASKNITIENLQLIEKRGGKSDYFKSG